MKILHICNLIGGVGVYIRNTVDHIDDSIEYVIARGKDDNTPPLTQRGMELKEYTIDLYREISLKDIRCFFQIINVIRKEKPDIIHCHSAKAGLLGRIAGFICGKKTIYSPHAFSFLSATGFKSKLFLFLEKLVKLNSYMLTGSNSEREIGLSALNYKSERTYTWNNTVPDAIEELNNSSTTILDNRKFNICSVGRPCYQKNVQFLIEVIKDVVSIIPESKFYLIGAGFYSPDTAEVNNLIKKYNLTDNVKLIEWLSHREMFKYLNDADLYMTSARYETLPLAVIEAMSLDCPVIASDAPGNVDCVFNGENGYLLPFEVELFVEKIVTLYNDDELRKRMGIRSRELFLEHFCIDSQIDKLKQIYERIANDK